jgi:hypothetical protein
MQWRTVTPEQKRLFREAIPSDARVSVWKISCAPADAEAENYLRQILQMFYESHVTARYDFDAFTPESTYLNKYGVLVAVKNDDSPNVKTLHRALAAAKIDHYLTTEGVGSTASDDFILLRVGSKPN